LDDPEADGAGSEHDEFGDEYRNGEFEYVKMLSVESDKNSGARVLATVDVGSSPV
jgi:hypothetical protein